MHNTIQQRNYVTKRFHQHNFDTLCFLVCWLPTQSKEDFYYISNVEEKQKMLEEEVFWGNEGSDKFRRYKTIKTRTIVNYGWLILYISRSRLAILKFKEHVGHNRVLLQTNAVAEGFVRDRGEFEGTSRDWDRWTVQGKRCKGRRDSIVVYSGHR